MTQYNSSFSSDDYLDEWSQPIPLPDGVLVQLWPTGVFPEPFESFAQELSRSTETPIELAAMTILSTIATIVHHKFEIVVKPDYREPLNLWTAVVLPPASRKSRVYSEVTKPLKNWEAEQKRILEPIINSIESKRKTIEVRLKQLRNTASKAKDDNALVDYQNQIETLEKNTPKPPTYPQIWTGDVTPEHLGNIMLANNEAMAVLSDEGGIFDILSGLYSDGKANIDLFLQAHAASSVRVDRGSRSPIFMQRPVLTMGLTVQPQTIETICKNKTFRGRGLLGRFLYVFPKSNIGTRKLDVPSMSNDIRSDYEIAMANMLTHLPQNNEKKSDIYLLVLTQEAFEKWLDFAKQIEILMSEDIDYLTHITDWAGKLPGAVARIAGLLHVMRYNNPWEYPIALKDIEAATKIGHCLKNHALKVFELIQTDPSIEIARSILNWIKCKREGRFSFRDVQRGIRRLKKADLKLGIELLKEHDYLKELLTLKEGPGRPSNLFDVNPRFFDE